MCALFAPLLPPLSFQDFDRQEQIISCTVTQLLNGMRTGDLTSLEIVTVYCLRALTIGAITNNVAEEFYDEAIEAAKKCDAKRAARRERKAAGNVDDDEE